jgi:voltage-gated potassium channel
MKLWKQVTHFFSGYYSLLLISLFLLFILRPYDRGIVYLAIWKACLTLVLFSSIFNCKHHRKIQIMATILVIPTFILTWINLFDRNEIMLVINAICTVLFISCITASILYDVIRRARVTLETLRGVICAYYMIAFAFGYIYYLVEFILPGTISFAGRTVSVHNFTHFLSEMLYFSFVTLLTIGYGDITAVFDTGQTIVVLEGMIGQFYIAILVARIVSVYSFYSDKRLLKNIEKDLKKK